MTPFVLDLVIWRVGLGSYDDKTEAKALARIEYALNVLEKHLDDDRTWLVSEELSLADLTLASALVWAFLHIIDQAMRKRFPNVVDWYLRTISVEDIKNVFGPPTMVSVRRSYPE